MLAVLALAGCNSLGIGTRVSDQGNGHYRITTNQSEDVAKRNAAAARDTCPGGYTLVNKGVTAESLYGSVIQGAELSTYWDIKCVQPK